MQNELSQRGLKLSTTEVYKKHTVSHEQISPIHGKKESKHKNHAIDNNLVERKRTSVNSASSKKDGSPALAHASSAQFRKKLKATGKKGTISSNNMHRGETTTTALESILETDEN